MKKKVEILAPAGSYESMKAAVAAGADAVYIGGSRFGARAYADNPGEDQLLDAIDYAHLHGCRLYLTVNTLVKDRELPELPAYLAPYYERGLDAAIVQDMGVFSVIRQHFPDLPIHASTQMTVTGPLGAALIRRMGASRIVPARELSLEEIRRMYEETGAELECFVHGALCYSYSGQCLFSSLIGGRSGNRGRCAQTCRLPFEVKRAGNTLNKKDGRYVLSLKDLCTLDILPDILEAGVYSLKIEGRMKSPRYTAGVVSIYRKYVDQYLASGRAGYRVEEEDRRILLDLFDRGGQTEGYYRRPNGRDMVVLKEKPAFREENRALSDHLDETFVKAEIKEPVSGICAVRVGTPLSLTLSCRDRLSGGAERTVTVYGGRAQEAKSRPATQESIRRSVQKTGNTPFEFADLAVELEGDAFVPVKELNELRRTAFEALLQALLSPHRREAARGMEIGPLRGRKARAQVKEDGMYRLNVLLERADLLGAVLSCPDVDTVYLDSAEFDAADWADAAGRCHAAGKTCFLALPFIFRNRARAYFEENRPRFLAAGFDGALVRSWEEIELLRKWDFRLPAVFDYPLYTMNRRAEDFIRDMAPECSGSRFTLPAELNKRELSERGCAGAELLVYGALPVMVTAQCMKKTAERCSGKPELLRLRDRMGKEFPVKNHCRFCYNVIYNSSPLSLLQEKEAIDRLGPRSLRLMFTTEDREEAKAVLRAFAGRFLRGEEAVLSGDFTRGHFKRGVE
ncbi:U32 family peptidase [Clostridiaceae bacterium]|nr:U32 family peptidase [Clostridiaceae bacterium]